MASEARIGPTARPFVTAFGACALAFAVSGACGGGSGTLYTGGADGSILPPGGGIAPIDGGGRGDGGNDGGADAGAGGDGGCGDAGPITHVLDNCPGPNVPGSVVFQQTGCQATLVRSSSSCNGVLSGSTNAFDGGCAISGQSGPVPCSGPSLPGTITCAVSSPQTCTFQFSP